MFKSYGDVNYEDKNALIFFIGGFSRGTVFYQKGFLSSFDSFRTELNNS